MDPNIVGWFSSQARMKEVIARNPSRYTEIEDIDASAEQLGLSAVVVQDHRARRIKVRR